MAQDFIIVAPGSLKGIGQGRHPVEGSVVVDRLRQFDHGGRQPGGVDGNGPERVAEDVTQ
jgi:hypothetical protein